MLLHTSFFLTLTYALLKQWIKLKLVSSERLQCVAYVWMYSLHHVGQNSPFTVTSASTLNLKQWIKTYFHAYHGISWTNTSIYIINTCLMISTLCQLLSVHEVSTLCPDVHAHIHETDLVYKKNSLSLHMAEFSLDFIGHWTQHLIYSCTLEKLAFGMWQRSTYTDITLEDNHC